MSSVKNGLYSIKIEMKDGGRGHASGVIVLLDGQILGGDTHFYYTGSYAFKNGKWRGELTTRQHQEAVGVILLFIFGMVTIIDLASTYIRSRLY